MNPFTDPSQKPDEWLIRSIIGDKILWWQSIMNYLYDNNTDITEVWKYYSDGKCWLFRTLKKKKTVFWISVVENTFSIGFYFASKASSIIEGSSLPERIKADFRNTQNKAFRGISIVMATPSDVEDVKKLIDIKFKIK